MRTEKDKIKDVFSSKLTGFEADPPKDMWSKIAEGLPAEVSPVRPKVQLYKKLMVVSTVAAAVIISFVLLLNMEGERNDKVNNIAESLPTESLPIEALNPEFRKKEDIASNEAVFDNKEVLSENKKPIASAGGSSTNTSLMAVANIQEQSTGQFISDADSLNSTDTQPIENNDENVKIASTDKGKEENVNKTILEDKIRAFANQGLEDVFAGADKVAKENTQKGISLSLAGNTGFSRDNNKAEVINSLRNVYTYHDEAIQDVLETLPEAERELPVKMTHRQPISFGITISKDLSSRFSIETGIVYTYLSSKIKNKPNSNLKRSDSQSFHYLGVPVSLNYNFAQWSKAQFYVSAGGMIQKDFYGRYKEEQVILNNREEQNRVTDKKKIHQDNPQFSVLGKVGVSYPVFDKIHAYATVGGAYYFDADHKYKTIYSEKKLQLDLNVGLRFKF